MYSKYQRTHKMYMQLFIYLFFFLYGGIHYSIFFKAVLIFADSDFSHLKKNLYIFLSCVKFNLLNVLFIYLFFYTWQVTSESDQKSFIYQGHIHSKDFGKFHLTRQGGSVCQHQHTVFSTSCQ